jgi:hypothetical protein
VWYRTAVVHISDLCCSYCPSRSRGLSVDEKESWRVAGRSRNSNRTQRVLRARVRPVLSREQEDLYEDQRDNCQGENRVHDPVPGGKRQ